MLNELSIYISKVLGLDKVSLTYIDDIKFGHIATNIAMVEAKLRGKNTKELGEEYVAIIRGDSQYKEYFSNVEVAGPGFINFTLTQKYLLQLVNFDLDEKLKELKQNEYNDKEVLVEYTDANPFKIFHIGHIMSNTIGEFIARCYEYRGAQVKRINYQGDVGRHIAINIYAILKEENYRQFQNLIQSDVSLEDKVTWLGNKYAEGFKEFDNGNQDIINDVARINDCIYKRSDNKINDIFDIGREWSLEYFETIYKLLGTKFDSYIYESEAAPIGLDLLNKNINLFEKSDGAIIYDGEKDGLHKRVFVNSNGLPTYECKDLGNMEIKLRRFPHAYESVVITGSEQIEYFKVLYKVISQVFPNLNNHLRHYANGMMKFTDGKMSSRKGNIIAGADLIDDIKQEVKSRGNNSKLIDEELEHAVNVISVGSIKYSILKTAVGNDVIFDKEKAISVDGDSAPYIQYTYARLHSALGGNISNNIETIDDAFALHIIKSIDILSDTIKNFSSQKLIAYTNNLAHMTNSWYANNKINNDINNMSIANKVNAIIKTNLNILGIEVLNKM